MKSMNKENSTQRKTFRLATEMTPWDYSPLNYYNCDRFGMIFAGYDGEYCDGSVRLGVIYPYRVDYDFEADKVDYEIESEDIRFEPFDLDLSRPSGWHRIYDHLIQYFDGDDLFVLVDESDNDIPISERWSLRRVSKEIFKTLTRREQ